MDPQLEATLRDIYANTKTIAVVGATPKPDRPAHNIPAYLAEQGYTIVPVTPAHDEVFGVPAFASLTDVDVPIDVVDVFRPPADAPQIVRDAITIGAKVVWLQLGIESQPAAEIAEEAGITLIMDRCMGATHRELGLTAGA